VQRPRAKDIASTYS